MIFFRTYLLRFLIPVLLAALGAALCRFLIPGETAAVAQHLIGFPDSDVFTQELRPLILRLLCFLPAVAGLIYALGGTLDRYIAREFGGIFAICLSSLVLIWLIMDLNDKIGDFRDSENVVKTIASFYAARSPSILLLLLPYSLLLSLLYSLGKLSGSREIIAMVQSGRSIVRIALPLLFAGVFFSLVSLGLNYQWAPAAEGNVDQIRAEAGGKKAIQATNVIYRNPSDLRLWKIGAFPQDYYMGGPLTDVEVTTSHPDKTLASRLTAKRALWNRTSQQWTFEEPVVGKITAGQPTVFETMPGPIVMKSWPETPFQLIKPGLSANLLGIPDLTTWLKSSARHGDFANPAPYLTQWYYRLSMPFTCLVTVLLATPLAVHFSRRGPGGGIMLAVILSGLMLLVTSISIALGESGTLQPMHAAWLPNIAFAVLGLYLFRRRITGRPIYLILRRLVPGND
ncbi:MAG: LptF/LptG family permease [Luteolibacter sp.]|uniref:LptF/LptG family permease n=1 Tax=Luteolibacter sp. TaxID=1962973 RepID=UPI00326321A9